MFRSGQQRSRVDRLRSRFERGAPPASSSIDEAIDRLSRAVERHFAEEEASGAVANRLVAALDVIPQGIVLADADGTVVFRNRVARGYQVARHGEALVESAIAELVAAAVQGTADLRTLDLYGPPRRAIQLRSVPLEDPDGQSEGPVGAFLVVDDVSDRQRLDAVRRDFVANISHELRTPVGAMGLLAETLALEDDPEVVARLALRVQREAFRLSRTVDDLLQLSQIEASELPSPEAVPMHLVLAEAIDRTRPAAELSDVRLVVDAPPRHLTVEGDRRQLVSAVANLCDNAVKYSDAGAQVTLSCRADGAWVELTVADEGIGIPARDLERVFERFYRVDRARSRDTGGTGLGLAIVRHVVQNHEGEVAVTSREGEGSTFTLRLPSDPTATATGDQLPAADPRPTSPTP